MHIGIIGAGKVGSAFGCILKSKGYEISGVVSKRAESAKILADRVNAIATTKLREGLTDAEIVLITTPDCAIADVVKEIAAMGRIGREKFIFHVCGSQSSEVLAPLKENGWTVGSMHPLQAFADVETAIGLLPGTYFAIDGDREAIVVAKQMIQAIGGQTFAVPSEQRGLYHAAACMASNYTVALVHAATQLLAKFGIKEAEGIDALMPILQGTLTNIQKQGTVKALTGPIVRGDALTVGKHREAIQSFAKAETDLYQVLGTYTNGIARQQQRLSKQQLDAFEKALQQDE